MKDANICTLSKHKNHFIALLLLCLNIHICQTNVLLQQHLISLLTNSPFNPVKGTVSLSLRRESERDINIDRGRDIDIDIERERQRDKKETHTHRERQRQ